MLGAPPFTQQRQHGRRQREQLDALAQRDTATGRNTPEAGFLSALEINPYYYVAKHNLAVTRQDRAKVGSLPQPT